jgi:hypothetical protein
MNMLSRVTAAALWFMAVAAYAGTIVVSGDEDIGDPLCCDSDPTNDGNETFFSNLLGAGTKVVVDYGLASPDFEKYYTGLGDTVNMLNDSLSGSSLTGANLFISSLPDGAYSTSQIAVIAAFDAGGGTVLFMGDNNECCSSFDGFINTDLTALGSGMQLGSDSLDPGFHFATGVQIAAVPLTAGVTSFEYGGANSVSGGTPVFYTANGTPFVEYSTQTSPTPEPGTTALLFVGLLPLLAVRKRTFRRS